MKNGPSNFSERLEREIASRGTALCVGIDPQPDDGAFLVDEFAKGDPTKFLTAFSAAMLDAAENQVAAVKFQSAYFEAYGPPGFAALEKAIKLAKRKNLLCILDAKRGDIASTMAAYGRMAFDAMGADALTVTPHLGYDVIEPLAPWLEKGAGIYLVWVTSNASAIALQELPVEGIGAYSDAMLRVLDARFPSASMRAACGLVLGATKVERLCGDTFAAISDRALLMPGVGAQGGIIGERMRTLIARRKSLVPQSRSLSTGTDGSTWLQFGDAVARRVAKAAATLAV